MSPISEKDTQYERTISSKGQATNNGLNYSRQYQPEQSKVNGRDEEDYDEYDEDEFEDVSLFKYVLNDYQYEDDFEEEDEEDDAWTSTSTA